MSIDLLICSQRKSNLFLKELIFKCPKTNLLILLTRISLRPLLAFETIAVEALEIFSVSEILSPNKLKSQFPLIQFNKFLAKILLPFLFRWSFLIPRCSSFIFSIDKKSIFFCIQKFFNRELVSALVFSIFLLSFLIIMFENDINDINPSVIKDIFQLRMTNRPTREKYKLNLQIPNLNQVRFRTKNLRYLHPKVCNSLSYHIKSSENLTIFKALIKNWNGTVCTCKICKK